MAQSKVKYYQLNLAGKVVKTDLNSAFENSIVYTDGTHVYGANQSMGGFKLTNLGAPTVGTDAATKSYVDAAVQGLDVKQSVRVATATNINLASPGSILDGITLTIGDRVLVKGQTDATQNGIYDFKGSSVPMTRSTDADTNTKVTSGMFTFVEEGANADAGFVLLTDGAIVLGTTPLNFSQFSGAGQITVQNALTKTGNIIELGGALIKNTTISGPYKLTLTNNQLEFDIEDANNNNYSYFASDESLLYTESADTSFAEFFVQSTNGGGARSRGSVADGARSQFAEIYLAALVGEEIQSVLRVLDNSTTVQVYVDKNEIKLGKDISGINFKGVHIDSTNAHVTIDDLAGFANYLVKVDVNGKLQLVNPSTYTYTANNGLTLTSNNVQLGGILIKDTNIDLDEWGMNYILNFGTFTIKKDSVGSSYLSYGSDFFEINHFFDSQNSANFYIDVNSFHYEGKGSDADFTLAATQAGSNAGVNLYMYGGGNASNSQTYLKVTNDSGITTSQLYLTNSILRLRNLTGGVTIGEISQPAGETLLFGTTVKITGPTTVSDLAGNANYLVRVDANGKLLTINPSNYTYSVDNGLNMSSNIIRLGGALSQATTISSANVAWNLALTGINTSANPATLAVSTTGSAGTAIQGTTTTGNGVLGVASGNGVGLTGYSSNNGTGVSGTSYTSSFSLGSGIGVYGATGTGTGVYAYANSTGIALNAIAGSGLAVYANSSLKVFSFIFDNPTAPSSGIHIVGSFAKTTTGQPIAGVGFGMSVEYQLANSTGAARQAGTHVFRWTNAVDASRSSAFDLTLVNNAISSTVLTVLNTGKLVLPKYGVNTFAGTAAYILGVDASGNLVEGATPATFTYTASNGLSMVSNDVKLGGTLTDLLTNLTLVTGNALVIAEDPINFINSFYVSTGGSGFDYNDTDFVSSWEINSQEVNFSAKKIDETLQSNFELDISTILISHKYYDVLLGDYVEQGIFISDSGLVFVGNILVNSFATGISGQETFVIADENGNLSTVPTYLYQYSAQNGLTITSSGSGNMIEWGSPLIRDTVVYTNNFLLQLGITESQFYVDSSQSKMYLSNLSADWEASIVNSGNDLSIAINTAWTPFFTKVYSRMVLDQSGIHIQACNDFSSWSGLEIDNTGSVTVNTLVGTGTRIVTATSAGKLGTSTASSVVSGTWVFKQTPTGAVNGTNQAYTITPAQVAGSEHVYLNGQLMKQTDDYTVSGQTITFTFAPDTGDKILVTFLKA
jgi:hypothetical protein